MPVFISAQEKGVEALLLIDKVFDRFPTLDRLHEDNLGIKAGLFIHNINKIIDKSAQEVSFPELQHAFRRMFKQITVVV